MHTQPSQEQKTGLKDSIEPDEDTIVSLRVLNMEEIPWTEAEEEPVEHPYYNNIPGKLPPPGGFIDARLLNQNSADGSQVSLGLQSFSMG